ncbi:hypothetical protein OIO90_001199 [Microbotryomycetes sp. JL221]|nr:hypothetical protein OIO90_001199 [Microbotryomycetes sp. JL221]
MSRAVKELDALFRWCLTGTPILNSLGDIFPLVRFLQVKPWYEWSRFNDQIVKQEKKRPKAAATKAQAILGACMLRRRKDTKLDGKELVTLPKKSLDDTMLLFSAEERAICEAVHQTIFEGVKLTPVLCYGDLETDDAVERKSQMVFNRYMRQGQVCLHPALIIEGEDILAVDKTDEEELKRATVLLGELLVKKLKAQRLSVAKERAEKERTADEDEDVELEGDECPICLSSVQECPEGGVFTKCSHLFCRTCISEVINKEQVDDGADEPGRFLQEERPCPSCRAPVSTGMLFRLSAFEPSDEELEPFLAVPPSPKKNAGKAKIEAVSDDEDFGPIVKKKLLQPNRAIIQDSDDDEELPTLKQLSDRSKSKRDASTNDKKAGKQKAKELPGWMAEQEPSTKMKWALDEVLRAQVDSPDDKFIIISTFTTALDMMEDLFDAHGVKVLRYQGDMNREHRATAVRLFRKKDSYRVLLLSLLSGGVGLNLTRANRVISLDLAWNKGSESQAFDRCHRIGQTKEVQINRVMVHNTVEQRINDLQSRKQTLADGALGEGSFKKIQRLSLAELANLFGLDRYGRRQVQEDYHLER